MGKKDDSTKNYVRRNDIFADIVNFCLFGGEKRVCPEDFVEKDVTELVQVYKNVTEFVSRQKLRDVLKQCTLKSASGYDVLVIGIENQSDIHYAMPVKNLIYDAINYTVQADNTARRHRQLKDLREDEFLSGFSKEDRLVPVVTITVYFGNKKWDGPRSLHEMLDIRNPEILQFVDNYHLNLVVPEEIHDFSKFRTQFGNVMEFIAASGDQDHMAQVMQNENYQHLERDAVSVMESCTNIRVPAEYESEGGVNVCKAWTDQYNSGVSEGKKEGIIEGKKEGIKEGGNTMVYRLVEKGALAPEGGAEELGISIEELEKRMLASGYKFPDAVSC